MNQWEFYYILSVSTLNIRDYRFSFIYPLNVLA